MILGTSVSATLPSKTSARDIMCLASTIHSEARGEPLKGQQAVGYVVLNRMNSPAFPKTICGVVLQHGQFGNGKLHHIPVKDQTYFLNVAEQLIISYNSKIDPSKGATYFHERHCHPAWVNKVRLAVVINHHKFYRV